jgi:hypothetical protein
VVDSELKYNGILEIKNKSSDSSNKYLYPQPDGQYPNYNSAFPKEALNKDKKFLKLLKVIKDEFDHGCKDYLPSLQAIN